MRPVTIRTLLFLLSGLAIPMPARAINAPTGLLCDLMRWPEKLVSRGRNWKIDLTVPGNVDAELWLPTSFSTVTIGGQAAKPTRKANGAGSDRNVFPLPLGTHTIEAK